MGVFSTKIALNASNLAFPVSVAVGFFLIAHKNGNGRRRPPYTGSLAVYQYLCAHSKVKDPLCFTENNNQQAISRPSGPLPVCRPSRKT